MANVRQREMPADPACKEIVKTLAELCYSRRQDDVFDLWLEAVDALMTMLPAHAASVAQTGRPAQDTPEVAETWSRIKSRFGEEWPKAETIFAKAWTLLLDSAFDEDGKPLYEDRLGEIYMAWSWPNSSTGQFFTPMEIARMMAMMTVEPCQAYATGFHDVEPEGVNASRLGSEVAAGAPRPPPTMTWLT